MRLLETIDRPGDIKALSVKDLAALALEIRQTLIQTISHLGGHLASSLGGRAVPGAALRLRGAG